MTEPSWLSPNAIVTGDVLRRLAQIQPGTVQVVVTSPPYWGQRRYAEPSDEPTWSDGTHTIFGLEIKPEDYVRHTVDVLRAIHRVLRDDGTVWWNIGDTYFTRAIIRSSSSEKLDAIEGRLKSNWKDTELKRTSYGHEYLKDKQLTLVPFQVALAAQQHIGYWVRSLVVWNKDNSVPERQIDRPVLAHEYILMLTKSDVYKWIQSAAREEARGKGRNGTEDPWSGLRGRGIAARQSTLFPVGETDILDGLAGAATPTEKLAGEHEQQQQQQSVSTPVEPDGADPELKRTRLLRAVWDMPSTSGGKGHPAAFPEELAERCIRLSSDPGDVILDPFIGSGTTALVADRLGRRYIGIDIVEGYAELTRSRVDAARREKQPPVQSSSEATQVCETQAVREIS